MGLVAFPGAPAFYATSSDSSARSHDKWTPFAWLVTSLRSFVRSRSLLLQATDRWQDPNPCVTLEHDRIDVKDEVRGGEHTAT